ncbi:hypothetical protein QQF64_007230 [Cirrhinus molitorella]|uniref:Uncharacterized protein n=1 Tax=Cirrhinus molitorella TaxID=172907 RepID=A0ABR3MA38_9TELE
MLNSITALFSKEDIQSGIASEIAAATSEGCISKTRSLIYRLAYLDTNSGSCSVTVDQCWRCYSMYFQGVNYPALTICTPRYDENTTVLKAVKKSLSEILQYRANKICEESRGAPRS